MILGSCGGLLLLALGAFAASSETPEVAASSQLADGSDIDRIGNPQFFFISKLTGLWQAVKDRKGNLRAERRSDHPSMERAIAMDYHYNKNLIFWSTYDGQIFSCPMKGFRVLSNDVRMVYSYSDWYPVSIAVDYISDLLYAIDSKTNTLSVMALDGSTGTNIIRSFDPLVAKDFEPRYLEIDPFKGLIFLMDSYNAVDHIYRMNIDGTDPQPIDNEQFRRQRRIGAFTLDQTNERILVSSPFDRAIVSVNYAGSDMRVVMRERNYASSLTIDEANSYLYFVNVTAYSMFTVQEKVTDIMKTDLFRCRIPSGLYESCEPGSLEPIKGPEWSAVLQLKLVQEPKSRPEQNHCREQPCEHMCIYTARTDNYSCKCRTGYRLTEKGRCQLIDEFLIYENDNYVAGIDMTQRKPGLDRPNNEVFPPFKIRIRPTGDDQFGFDYDPLQRLLLFSNNHEVIARNLDDAAQTYPTLINPLSNYGLLAIDSTSKQFYFVEVSNESSDKWSDKLSDNSTDKLLEKSKPKPMSTTSYSIGVSSIIMPGMVDMESLIQRTFVKMLRRDVGRVRSLAVHPGLGYVFYVSFNAYSTQFQLTRMMVDGSKVVNLSCKLGSVMFMALDYDDERIYYIDDKFYLRRADFDGHIVEKLVELPLSGGSPLGCINGLSVYGDWVYVKDSNNIRRYNKALPYNLHWEDYDPKPYNFKMQTQLRYHSDKSAATKSTPCSDKMIHGCMQLCFALPNAEGKLQPKCACDDRNVLKPDGKSCD